MQTLIQKNSNPDQKYVDAALLSEQIYFNSGYMLTRLLKLM